MKDITSTITKPLAVLGENGKGYTKEANFISWNGNAAKLDIREWHPNHERCGKGITLTEDEGRNLYAALKTSMKMNNPFSAGNGAFGNGCPYFYRHKNSRIHNRIRHIHKDYLYLSRICSKDNCFRLVLRAKALLNL